MFKAEAKTGELLRQLKRCAEVVPTSAASPMLLNAKISFEKEQLRLYATDMEA